MLWVVVFASLAFVALVAVGYFAFQVWRAGLGLSKQLGASGRSLGGHMTALTEALDRLGEQSPPRRR